MPIFPAYTREELITRARNLLRTRRRGIDLGPYSDYDLWARILGLVAWAEQKRAESALSALDPRTSVGEALTMHARDHGIVTEGVRAEGWVILLAEGPLAVQPGGSVLRHVDGTEYTLDADAVLPDSIDEGEGEGAHVQRFYAGHRSGRRRLYQGRPPEWAFREPEVGQVYRHEPTGELVALRAVDNADALRRYLVELYNDLAVEPALHDRFTRQRGIVARVTAAQPGARGNKDPKDVLRLVEPYESVRAEAYVLRLEGGRDALSPGETQAALAALFRERGPLGSLEELRQLGKAALEQLTECYVVPATHGIGSYTLLPVRAEGAYVGEADQQALVRYVGARVSPADRIFAATVYEQADTTLDFVDVQVSPSYRPDWAMPAAALTPGLAGLSATGGGMMLSFVEALPAELGAGCRVLITYRATPGPYLCQRTIVALADRVATLDAPLPFPPEAEEVCYVTPGGPLGERLLEALYAAYDARPPSAGVPLRVRHPPTPAGDDAEALIGALARVEGVLDVAYARGDAPDLSEPGGVLVPACVVRMFA